MRPEVAPLLIRIIDLSGITLLGVKSTSLGLCPLPKKAPKSEPRK